MKPAMVEWCKKNKQIFFLGCYNKEVEVLGTLGLLMAIQKRFSEAIKYYKAAEEILENKNKSELLCYILGQQSILDLIQKNYSAAENIAIKALEHAFTGKTKAFALEVLCRIAFAKQKWKKTVQYAKDASKLYFNDRNYSSYFECEYLIAEANSNLGHVNVAETCLRKIIDQEKSHKSCFHIANAYTLLGLLLLKKNDVKGAKTVFSQSLNLELYNERNIGVAIDYTNLAIVEQKSGNIEKAKDNINIALKYAKDVDRELYENIKNLLN
jgi:tetratricopeptide (TPR) repeat protein